MKEPRKPVSARIEYLGRTPRTFELPIPFVQKCEKTGEVKCDPVGTFPIDDAERLLAISGADGLFRLIEYVYEDQKEDDTETMSTKQKEDEPVASAEPIKAGKRPGRPRKVTV